MSETFGDALVAGPGGGQAGDLIRLASGYWLAKAVSTAADLGLADALEGGPLEIDELARRLRADADALERLLRVLVGAGIFERDDGSGRIGLNGAAGPLRSDHPQSVRAMVRMLGAESFRAWARLTETVERGTPAFDLEFGRPFYEHLDRDREARRLFDRAMRERHPALQPELVPALSLGGARHLLDVGAGMGELSARALERHPALRATLVDTPESLSTAGDRLREAGVMERAALHATRRLDELPGPADHVVVASLIHNLDDEAAVGVLRACREALAQGGRVTIAEIVLPPVPESSYAALLDLNMLVLFNGRERTIEEHAALLARAGLLLEGADPLDGRMTLIRAGAAP